MSVKSYSLKINIISVTALVVSNMIGTGIFTSLGFQLVGIKNIVSILLLWVLGAVIALCGAMVYGELGAAMPRSGGEYHYLSKIYHPALGFLSGWVSITIGFSAPIALSSMAFGAYISRVFHWISPLAAGCTILVLLTLLHCSGIKLGTLFQNLCTALNIALILFFVIYGLFFSHSSVEISLLPDTSTLKDIINPSFAVALIYVTYAYSGWNAAAYIAGDLGNPQKILPLSLCIGTCIVAVLYLLLNYTFLSTASVDELAGKLEVAYISSINIFGPFGAKIIGFIISMLLVASVSSFIFIGPRITQIMGEDIQLLHIFSRKSAKGVPLYAMLFQFIISLILILTTSFESALTYVGFTLNICTFLTVFGVFVHRHKYPSANRPYKIWGYPYIPVFFLILTAWILIYLLIEKPFESIAGLLTVLTGLIFYLGNKTFFNKHF